MTILEIKAELLNDKKCKIFVRNLKFKIKIWVKIFRFSFKWSKNTIKLPDINNAIPKLPDINNAVAKLPDINNAVPKIPDINNAVPKLPDINNAVPKLPDINNAVPSYLISIMLYQVTWYQ